MYSSLNWRFINQLTECITTSTLFPEQELAAHRFSLNVDAIAAPDVASKGKAYFLCSGLKDVKDDDLQFKEFARYIENALAPKGYVRVDSDQKANLLIRLSYGVGTPQITKTTYTTSYGYSYPVGWMWYSVAHETATSEIASYPITVCLDAYDLKTPSQSQAWKATITGNSRVPNNIEGGIFIVSYVNITDLRVQVPYLLAAASDYLGTNTGRAINTVVMGNDPRVPVIMGSAAPAAK